MKLSKATSARKARKHCYRHFWRFARELLSDDAASGISPQFSSEEAFSFFSSTYQSNPASFTRPSWMPAPKQPSVSLEVGEICLGEVEFVIRHSKSSSSPCPFDQIPYVIFKRCPALIPALVDLFTCCWMSKTIPSSWKVAGIKLLGKTSAVDNPSSPTNFRPIALTSCIGKIFTTILKNRWLDYMLKNGYLNTNIQKAFVSNIPGCTEHQAKLAAVLSEARKKHKSLAVAWLDLANAYGSVHHSLIQFSLKHYHAPPEFCSILRSLYSGLTASILTNDWQTSEILLEVGVYQGDPLSVAIFNMVINTLADTLMTRSDLGYALANLPQRINLLQYADDVCWVTNSPAACQHLLTMVDNWLVWSGMKAKVTKCHSLGIHSSSGSTFDPKVTLSGELLPFLGNKAITFLGLSIQVPNDPKAARQSLKNTMIHMLQAVDQCPVTRKQKLKLYKLGICPQLIWPLTD